MTSASNIAAIRQTTAWRSLPSSLADGGLACIRFAFAFLFVVFCIHRPIAPRSSPWCLSGGGHSMSIPNVLVVCCMCLHCRRVFYSIRYNDLFFSYAATCRNCVTDCICCRRSTFMCLSKTPWPFVCACVCACAHIHTQTNHCVGHGACIRRH